MANRRFTSQFLYQFEVMPVLLSCNFIVDSTNGNGLGLRSLKGEGIKSAFMHTTAPLVGSGNPNPQSGQIMVQLSDNYNRYLSGFSGQIGTLGASSTSVTSGVGSVITVLGTASLAQWQAKGLPVGVTPAVGVAFIPTATGLIGGSAQAAPTSATGSNIDHIEVLGNPNLTLSLSQSSINGGGIIIMNCLKAQALQAPNDGSVIGLNFYLSNSGNTVKGQ